MTEPSFVEKRSTLKRKYLQHIKYLNIENIVEEFNNCSQSRILLYTLRECLLKFIEDTIEDFIRIHSLLDKDKSFIRKKIKAEVRVKVTAENSTHSSKSLENKAKDRKNRIDKLTENQIAADWRTIAKCYTGSFFMNKQEAFDPKDLLEILMYCSLFDEVLYPAALNVIISRNIYYGHIAVLHMDNSSLKTFQSDVKSLLKLIPTQYAT